MSDYKRLVAYIYLYNNGIRARNIGFTKAEAKDGQLRLQVHIKGAWSAEGNTCDAYLFYRNKEQLKGVYIGDFSVTNGTGELKVSTDSSNIMKSGVAFAGMAGIIMKTSSGGFFATRWDDEPMDLEKFALHGTDAKEQKAAPQEEEHKERMPQSVEGSDTMDVQAAEFMKLPDVKQEPEFSVMDPADLLQYGESGRRLVNNSFLLHGYYNYGHLLYGHDEQVSFLGVPGEFCMQEKMMASLFGFSEFRTLDSFKRNTGNAGYWLRRF